MFNLKRNQVIITVLVFMIAIAAYLNTQQSPVTQDGNYVADSTMTDENTAEETDLFSGYDEVAATDTQKTTDESQLTVADANTSEGFTATISKKAEELTDTADVAASKSLDVNYFAE